VLNFGGIIPESMQFTTYVAYVLALADDVILT